MKQEKESLTRIFLRKITVNGIVVDGKGTFKHGNVVVTQEEQGELIRLINATIPELMEVDGKSNLLNQINNNAEGMLKAAVTGMRKADSEFLQKK